jgi:hypothetical protein
MNLRQTAVDALQRAAPYELAPRAMVWLPLLCWGMYILPRIALQGDTAKARPVYQMEGLPRSLERRRPRHPHPQSSQSRVREAAVANIAQRQTSGLHDKRPSIA